MFNEVEMTAFYILYTYILKYTFKKRGTEEKSNWGEKDLRDKKKKNGLVCGSQKTQWRNPDTQCWRSSSKIVWENHFISIRDDIAHKSTTYFSTSTDQTLANWIRCRGYVEGVWMADCQPEHISRPAMVHSPVACNTLHPGGTSHESKWGVSWLKQCRGRCWWKTSEQEFKGAAWQDCYGVTGVKGVEHAACTYSWKTIQKEVKRLSCFAYNLRKEDPAKEDLRNKKQLVQKRWQRWCTFCWASCHHLLRSWGPREAVPQLWSCMTLCVLAQGVHHICDQISWKEKSHYHRQGNSCENTFTFRKAEEADKWVWRARRNSQAHFRTRWSLSLLERFLLPLFCDRKQGLQLVYVFIKMNDF